VFPHHPYCEQHPPCAKFPQIVPLFCTPQLPSVVTGGEALFSGSLDRPLKSSFVSGTHLVPSQCWPRRQWLYVSEGLHDGCTQVKLILARVRAGRVASKRSERRAIVTTINGND
jgi:hypothetical protein